GTVRRVRLAHSRPVFTGGGLQYVPVPIVELKADPPKPHNAVFGVRREINTPSRHYRPSPITVICVTPRDLSTGLHTTRTQNAHSLVHPHGHGARTRNPMQVLSGCRLVPRAGPTPGMLRRQKVALNGIRVDHCN